MIPDNEVMAYPKISDVAHEFVAWLQFGTTFEVIEFLAGQQIKLSQCMAEEHAKMQMLQRVLAGTAERKDERTLDKIGRIRNADEGRIGIQLPPLNAALVEVHRELATVHKGTNDMVTKNKRLKKKEKYVQGQLAKAHRRITELEEQLQAQPMGPHPTAVTTPQDRAKDVGGRMGKSNISGSKTSGRADPKSRNSRSKY